MSEDLPHVLTINDVQFVKASPWDLAASFAEMGDDGQAAFLDAVARLSGDCPKGRASQWHGIARQLSPEATTMLREWAEYFAPETV